MTVIIFTNDAAGLLTVEKFHQFFDHLIGRFFHQPVPPSP
jgi:hypothetical protein